MPLIVITLIIQIGLVIHVLKTGRDRFWVTILIMVPGLGAAVGGQRSIRKAKSVISPNAELNKAFNNAEISDTFKNRLCLGNELIERGHFADAIETLRGGLKGMYEFEPAGLVALAQAQFGNEQYDAAKTSLDTLIKQNPNYKNQDAHLLYARCLEELNDVSAAAAEYDVLVNYYSGPEPHVRYAELLMSNGQDQRARVLLDDVLKTARMSAKHYTPGINSGVYLSAMPATVMRA